MMQEKKSGHKKSIILIAMLLMVLVLVVLCIVFALKQLGEKLQVQEPAGATTGFDINMSDMTDMVSAYGVTSIGVVEAEFPIEDLSNRLEVEEVYISTGDEIEEGMPVFRFTQESVEAVKLELEENLRATNLAYRAGYIEYEQSKITALYDKEETLLSGEKAEEVYEETISGLYSNVEKTKEELDDVKEQIAEIENAINNNSFYEDHQVGYYKNIYDENLAILKAKVEEWGISWQEVTSGGGGMARSNQLSTVSGGDAGVDLHSQYVTVLSSFYKVLEQNLSDYEQAQKSYEEAVENASFNLQTLKLQKSTLEEKYAEALENYETSILQAQLTRETTLVNAQKAENIYETNMEKAEADYEELADAYEEAQNNLDIFNEQIIDNCFYVSEPGYILRISVRAGDEIGSESRMYTLRDTEEMTVTVSVAQEDIAKLQVGDNAMVVSTENGTYAGIVAAISPISASTSKTSITYSVTVQLSGELGNLETNETVVVYFGVGNGVQNNE